MGKVIKFHKRLGHAQRSRTKASRGTAPLEISLMRWASPRLTSLRPAKMLRTCESEQPAASARSLTLIPLAFAQRCMGCINCGSDMGEDISDRNTNVNSEIFPVEISLNINGLIKCDMGKSSRPEPREIYLGAWLRQKGVGVSEAARIAGCTQSYISNISGGKRPNINALYLLILSEHLEISVNDFFQPPPPVAHVESFKRLSEKAQKAILGRKARKA